MDCREAREGLWPPERPRLVGGDVAKARLHVASCDDCKEYFQQDRALLDAYDRVRRQPAPRAVRERVFNSLALARWAGLADTEPRALGERGRWTRVGGWSTAIAAGLALVVLWELPSVPATTVDDPAVFVEDYLRRAVGQDHIDSNDPDEVRRFLQRELGMQLQPLQFVGLDVARAEICLLEGRRGAMIVYKKDGAEISHYLIPREGAERRAPAVSEGRADALGHDMAVVTWSTRRLEQALVGELTSRELLELARRGSSDY
jgi:hypothetical protein